MESNSYGIFQFRETLRYNVDTKAAREKEGITYICDLIAKTPELSRKIIGANGEKSWETVKPVYDAVSQTLSQLESIFLASDGSAPLEWLNGYAKMLGWIAPVHGTNGTNIPDYEKKYAPSEAGIKVVNEHRRAMGMMTLAEEKQERGIRVKSDTKEEPLWKGML